jgi:hypothetical protein
MLPAPAVWLHRRGFTVATPGVTLAGLVFAVGLAGSVAPAGAGAAPAPGGEPAVPAPGAMAAAPVSRQVAPVDPAPRELQNRAPERWIFPARPNVCGTGDGIVLRSPDGSTSHFAGRGRSITFYREWQEGDPPCESGVAVVEFWGGEGERTAVRVAVTSETRVGRGPSGPERWLEAKEAANRLLAEARVARDGRVARRLVMAAALADAVVWPGLLELARDRGLEHGTREAAIHWLGREAAASAASALDGMVRDPTESDEIRDAAVFALAQLPDERAVPLLIEVVRTSDSARVRSRALFWLAEFDDPRALALFEEILLGPG